ncbi:MAG: methanogenesis marker 2 protein, partial [Methanobacteriota archaeon]
MTLDALVRDLRSYRGVSRKREISSIASRLLCPPDSNVIASYGEDAAAIDYNSRVLLLAADGIMEDLITSDPYWAGYCSVLVNVNDVAAMGGLPIAAVDIISCGDEGLRDSIVEGLSDASSRFQVPIVGGHLHPDTSYSAIDVAVLGETDRQHLVTSSSAVAGDDIIFSMDLEGRFTPGIPYSWDTTSNKGPDEVRRRLASMHAVAPMLSAGKDISNPGALGSAGMLMEASGVGGRIAVDMLPKPEGVDI